MAVAGHFRVEENECRPLESDGALRGDAPDGGKELLAGEQRLEAIGSMLRLHASAFDLSDRR